MILLLTLVLAPPPAVATAVRIDHTPAGDRLVVGSDAFPLIPQKALPSGRNFVFNRDGGTLELVSQGQKLGEIDLRALTAQWLEDDSVWGSHDWANQMRYMARDGGGVDTKLTQLYIAPDGSGLGLLNVYWAGPSMQPVAAQFLAKVRTDPFSLERLQSIPNDVSGAYFSDKPRLFRSGPKLLCIDGDAIESLDWSGAAQAKLCPWDRREVPIGIAAHRWIVGTLQAAGEFRIVATDLSRGKSFDLVRVSESGPQTKPVPNISSGSVSADSEYVLLSWNDPSGALHQYTVHLPDGKRMSAAADAAQVAGPYVVGFTGSTLHVYSAATGKLVGSAPVKPAGS